MLPAFRRIVSAFIASLAAILTLSVQPAMAQSGTEPTPLIQASFVYDYARYYTPYAIQAAAAYLSVDQLNALRAKQDPDGYGSDVNYTLQNVFSDQIIGGRAKKAFKAWQYQFGSEAYLSCIDPGDSACQEAYRNRGWAVSGGPAFQVWARTRFPHTGSEVCTEVSIAFRGTMGFIGADWLSNIDRLGSPYDDYYHQLRRNIDGIISSIKGLDCYKRARSKPQIVSTGHSLGGGLAQLAALANSPTGIRITKVFAFDPSPVTGARLVEQQLRDTNARGLTIDRIYQEGEILAYARRAIQEYPSAKSSCDPMVRTVRVDAIPPGTSIQLHGMAPLAAQMVQLSYTDDTELAYRPPQATRCRTRYRPPATDQDDQLVAGLGGRRALAAFARSQSESPLTASDMFGTQTESSVAVPARARTHRVVMISGGHRGRRTRTVIAGSTNGAS